MAAQAERSISWPGLRASEQKLPSTGNLGRKMVDQASKLLGCCQRVNHLAACYTARNIPWFEAAVFGDTLKVNHVQ